MVPREQRSSGHVSVMHRFKKGDKVVFTNEYGVCFGVKTITELDTRGGRPVYYYAPSDSLWFPTDEEHLSLADELDLEKQKQDDMLYFQDKYGFEATNEQRAALLDFDHDP